MDGRAPDRHGWRVLLGILLLSAVGCAQSRPASQAESPPMTAAPPREPSSRAPMAVPAVSHRKPARTATPDRGALSAVPATPASQSRAPSPPEELAAGGAPATPSADLGASEEPKAESATREELIANLRKQVADLPKPADLTPPPAAAVQQASALAANSPSTPSTKPAEPLTQIPPSQSSPSSPATSKRAAPTNEVRTIVDRAAAYYAAHPNYTCRVTRREVVGHKAQAEEKMKMNFRLQPRSVKYTWLDEANAGRECVYVEGQNDGKLVTRGGKSDFLMTGRRITVDPNGMLSRSKSRYSITEAGLDNMVRRLSDRLARQEKGDLSEGPIRYAGKERRPEAAVPLHHLINEIPPKADPAFPKGATRHWYFDPESGALVVMHAVNPNGDFIEYYAFDKFIPNDTLTAADFDPDVLWPKGGGSNGPDERKTADSRREPPK